jgi:hypothetical protein
MTKALTHTTHTIQAADNIPLRVTLHEQEDGLGDLPDFSRATFSRATDLLAALPEHEHLVGRATI